MGALRGIDPAVAQQDPPAIPLPLAARSFLLALQDGAIATHDALTATASDLLRAPAALTRGRRALQMTACAFIPLLMPIAVIGALRVQQHMQSTNARGFEFDTCVKQLAFFEKTGESHLTPLQKERRRLIEIFIAEHLQDEVAEAAAVARSFPNISRGKSNYSYAERAIANHPTRTPEDVKKAEALVARLVENSSQGLARLGSVRAQWALITFILAWACACVAVLALVGAIVTRAGFTLRTIGAALVNRRGENVSRLRAAWRAIITWLPAFAALALVRFGPKLQEVTVATALLQTLPLALLAAGAVLAIRNPSRSVQDRLAGTWIVPR